MEHPGSRDTYNILSAGQDGRERFRILESLGGFLLNGTPGEVLEIGVGESSFFLGRIAHEFKRRIYHCDVSPSKIVNPMTIDGYLAPPGEPITYFEERDPVPSSLGRVVAYAGTSDSLFSRFPDMTLGLTFIDGDHLYEQARRDFFHAWDRTVDHGYILLHDSFPPTQEWTDENKCGLVYQLRRELEANQRMDVLTIPRGCVIGVGLTIVRKRPLIREPWN